jgi:putative exosortase-associated protein (TIGR04073 family)
MIKNVFISAFILLFIMILAAPAFCEDPATRLGRGLSNILTSPLELPSQSSKVNNTDGPFAGLTVGVLKGLQMTVTRAAVGLYEVATFMMPSQKDSGAILKDPEYFLENSNY